MAYHVSPHIHYLGVADEGLDLFEGQFPLTQGVRYNSYLVDCDKLAIMDTVELHRGAEWLSRLDEALDGRHPDYLVVQHLEPDHSGMIEAVAHHWPGITLVMSKRAWAMLPQFMENFEALSSLLRAPLLVGDGDELSLGEITLRFVTAPMVHWPEVLMTYAVEERVLFSADAFGTFSAPAPWPDEARRYYCNIVGRYGAQVQTLLRKVSVWDIDCICPLHGPVLTHDLDTPLGLYDTWSRYEPEMKGTLVAHASIYGNTAAAARRCAHMLREAGAGEVTVMDLARTDTSYAVAEAFRLSSLVLACATYDGMMFPPMEKFLYAIDAKGLRNRRVGLIQNGSWAPATARIMAHRLGTMKNMQVVEPVVTLHTRLRPQDLPRMAEMARALTAD